MRPLDRFLQNWRLRKALKFLEPGMRILDLGSADGLLFRRHGRCGAGSVGIDPVLTADSVTPDGFRLLRGFFPKDMPPEAGPFDAVVMLAVLEHIPEGQLPALVAGVEQYLRPGGRLIITVPEPFVDRILTVLRWLRLIQGMSLEEHHGFEVGTTEQIFSAPTFRLHRHNTFQLGLNHLFVFERTEKNRVGAGN